MTAELWLSKDEIKQMCRASTKKLCVEFLVRNGMVHRLDRHGWPVVSRAVAEVGGALDTKPADDEWRSNKVRVA